MVDGGGPGKTAELHALAQLLDVTSPCHCNSPRMHPDRVRDAITLCNLLCTQGGQSTRFMPARRVQVTTAL